jgi:hypothetical protein
MASGADDARSLLRAAWDDMLAEVARARDAIDQPELMPAPADDRNLAEGYRYLLGYAHSAIERAFFGDPRFPVFQHAIQIVNKATIDNADAIYFMAAIDGRARYRIEGRAGDARHWRGAAPAPGVRRAPQYVIFEVSDGCIAGDSGSLAELRPGVKVQTGRLDSSAIEVGPDGRFEILLAPERPAGYTGHFIPTHKRVSRPHPDDPDGPLDRYACYVSGRQLFYDWASEDPVALTITRVGAEEAPPPPYDSATAAAELRRMGALVRGQMHFWNEFYTVLLETYGKRDGSDGERFMPRNRFNAPNAASGATGGGQSTNIYAGGVYELEPDEALVIHARTAIEPQYIGFHLSNLWGESHDFANHQSSLNGFQADREPDGSIYWVVAHRDPGVANWVDTTGHREGFMAPRWAYSETPPKDQWPTISAEKVAFDAIRDHLPADVRTVGPEERAAVIRMRQEHVQRRYRPF